MTNDYKEKLLNYITDNLIIESQGSNSFKGSSELVNNLVEELENLGITRIVGNKFSALTTDTTSNYILYGNYIDENNENIYHGIIIVFSQTGEIEKIFTSFDSGTLFSQIIKLNYAEDGNIYGVDWTEHNGSNYYPRVILLNNVALKTANGYSCKLRASYYYPSEYEYFLEPYSSIMEEGTSFIKKVNGEATYFIVGSLNSKVCLLKFVINVGSENEWTLYQGSSIPSIMFTTDFIIEKSGNTNVIHLYYQTNAVEKKIAYDYFDGTTLTRQGLYSTKNYVEDIKIKSSNQVYFSSLSGLSGNSGVLLQIFLLNNGVISSIYEESIENSMNNKISLNYLNDLLFFTEFHYDYEEEKNCVFCGMYENGNTYTYQIDKDDDNLYHPCIVQNTFDLYKIILQDETKVYQPSIVYYDNYYNGSSYQNYNSLVASHGELYNENNIIFARDLYNKTTYNNTTTSTLEVPFNYINDISIDNQNLLSETKTILIDNNNTITKNIYETLFINFINTISVIDEDTNTSFINVANYVNTNINTGTETNYNNTKCSKFRINYEDETISISALEWLPINKYNKTTQITFYADKNITSIDLISEDETTVYLNIPVEVEVGNYYTIRQKVRTGNKPTPVQLQYNNENINYNNEPVMVYMEEE